MKVCMIITDGFEEVEAIGTYAILRRGGIEVDIYSLLDKDATGRFGLTCTKLKPFSKIKEEGYSALILPGGPEYVAIEASDEVQNLIKSFNEKNKYICAICAGPTILGRAGYLENKKYTCFTSMNDDFKGTYVDEYVVTDKNIITGRSAAASIDFGFAILKALMGEQKEKEIKEEIYY
ncbi:DJ-1/PfpI family protein [Anaerofustis sp.]|uniref:DJ-1/PfpI family protein n=1 Tax=Anaerofustis sp. TaxID=1872517 RepID=UPI0025BCE7E4|nr:DJ-1/PfpI family protein [Anaerofustis sp.]